MRLLEGQSDYTPKDIDEKPILQILVSKTDLTLLLMEPIYLPKCVAHTHTTQHTHTEREGEMNTQANCLVLNRMDIPINGGGGCRWTELTF
jgi:hypothetical protein